MVQKTFITSAEGSDMAQQRVIASVALLALVVLAGCSAAGSLDMRRATDDAELADRQSRPTTVPVPEPTQDVPRTGLRTRLIVRRAVENGSTTARSHDPPVEPGHPFEYEGRYYNLSRTVIDREQGTLVCIELEANESVPENQTVAYSALSDRDREVLAGVLPPALDDRATYNASERNRSVLLSGEYQAVRYRGETYPYDIEDTDNGTINTYRYVPELIANTSSEYAKQLRDAYLFELANLSADQRQGVEKAIKDTYYAEDDGDEAFKAVLTRFQRHEAVEADEYQGTWLVRYRGEIYLAELEYGGFDEYVDE